MVWQLWSRNRQDEPQGVFSHATALTPARALRRDAGEAGHDSASRIPEDGRHPDVLRLHHARLSDRDVQTIDGVRVTTPLRTLIDVIAEGAIAPELQVQAVDQALRRGVIMRRQLETARVSTRARQRIDRILKQVPMAAQRQYATAGAFRTALEARLNERARREGVDLHRLRRQVAFDRLLARMFDPSQPVRDGWVLKGGYALEMRFQMARSTKDLDLTVRSAQGLCRRLDLTARRLQVAASIELPDFFTFIVGEAMAELNQAPEGGARFPSTPVSTVERS